MAQNSASPIILNGQPLSTDDVLQVARFHAPVELDAKAREQMNHSRTVVDEIEAGGRPVYGINTGFGSLSQMRVDHEGLLELQRNIVHSHAAGVGDPLPEEVVRAIMVVLAASLARGRSGVRPVVVEQLIAMLAHNLVPIVPSRGSVGASGDLAPLAHIALTLIGDGELTINDQRVPTSQALAAAEVRRLQRPTRISIDIDDALSPPPTSQP